jgi:type II secretory ATPase GspE/PulE/Tfp pilus assembly ATPase PilB-like protein
VAFAAHPWVSFRFKRFLQELVAKGVMTYDDVDEYLRHPVLPDIFAFLGHRPDKHSPIEEEARREYGDILLSEEEAQRLAPLFERAIVKEEGYWLLPMDEGQALAVFTLIPFDYLVAELEDEYGLIVEPRLLLPSVARKLGLVSAGGEEGEGRDGQSGTPEREEGEEEVEEGEIEELAKTSTAPVKASSFSEGEERKKEERSEVSPHEGKDGRKKKAVPSPFSAEVESFILPSSALTVSVSDVREIDEKLLASLPKELMEKLRFIPWRIEGDKVAIITPDPKNFLILDTVQVALRRRVIAYEIDPVGFDLIFTRLFRGKGREGFHGLQNADEVEVGEEEESHAEEEERANEGEARQYVTRLLKEALYNDASDIHLIPERSRVRVQFRKDGVLRDYDVLNRMDYPSILSVIKLMSGMNISEKRLPQDGRLRHRVGGARIDLRVSTVPTVYGERVVMRLLKRAENIPEVEELGFLPDTLEKFKKLIAQPYGLILITGPTGSGKSFTSFSALKRIKSPEKNILTVEDPVEYEIPGISQVQVKPQIGLTFAAVLRSFLRQDPDVIMVGEIRDEETARIAIEAALTGHLVLATLHTNDAPQAILRLEEMGLERYNVAAALLGVLAQRLVRKLCPKCKTPSPQDKVVLYKELMEEAGLEPEGTFYEAVGCEACGGTGFKGRMPIHELLVMDDQLRELLSQKSGAAEIREAAFRAGMRTLRQDGLLKAAQGLTTVQEVLSRTLE